MALAALMVLTVPARSDESLIRSEVTRQIVKNFPWSGEDVEVYDITLTGPDVTKIKFDSVSVKVPKRMTNIGKVTVLAKLSSGKKEVGNIWVSARIRVFKKVVVALNSIRMNDRITKDDVKLMRMETRNMADTLASVDEAVGMLALRPIPEGTVIKSDCI